ncbi:hypothetical protein G7050_00145 [Dysgonomonas sp. HDW5A]|uniref:hypothetical protein n=1 Tax=Dysgonomonas sp. HDW5A TaxID=2714926 RepID=UPI00140BF982|nr:hypothetical protein [Dysgonomonas sp. HDW5A]QIK58328.1 hypothetical protein G7050_00145 [Dysgonomonas sp. HDW5A]
MPFPYIAWRWSNYDMIDVHLLGKQTNYELTRHPGFFSQGSFGTNYFYDQFHINDDPLGFVPYSKGNLLYTLARRGIYKTDMGTMKTAKVMSFDETIDLSMSCDQYSSRVAVRDYNKISIYKNHSFTNPTQIELAYGVHPTYEILKFTSDNKLLISSNNSGSNFYNISLMVFDANTGKYLYDIPIPTSGKNINEMRLSADNKYMLLSLFNFNDESSMQVDILELNGNQTKLIKTSSYNDLMANGPFIYFNSSNPTQLIQGNNQKFRVSELPSFNKIAEIDGQFSFVDVVNGNFLYTTSGQLYQNINVVDPTFSKLLFQMSIDSEEPLSYNNILVSPSMHAWGSYFDISKFMKKTK